MKKVRYAGAIGAVGMMPAFLGLTAPAAVAAAHAPASAGKTVVLAPATAPCNARQTPNSANGMNELISYSRDNGCIGFVRGSIVLSTGVSNLWMRVRRYFPDGTFKSVINKNGHIIRSPLGHNSSIYWISSPRWMDVTQVCVAVIAKGHPVSQTFFGPVCIGTGFTG